MVKALVLSLACMQIQEVIAGLFRLRANNLKDAIREMLAHPRQSERVVVGLTGVWRKGWQASPGWVRQLWQTLLVGVDNVKIFFRKLILPPESSSEIVEQLYQHPLIRSLAQPGSKPAYIPAQTFTLALFDTVMLAGTDASTIQTTLEALKSLLPQEAQKQNDNQPSQSQDPARPNSIPPEPRSADEAKQMAKTISDLLADAKAAVKAAKADPDQAITKLNALHAGLKKFMATYPQLEPVMKALLPASLPKDHEAIMTQILRGATILAQDNSGLTQALNSLFRQVELSAISGETALARARMNVETWFNDTMDRASGWYKRRTQWTLLGIGIFVAILLNVDTTYIVATLWREPALRQALTAHAEQYKLPASPDAGSIPLTQTIAATGQIIRDLDVQLRQELQLPIGWEVASGVAAAPCFIICQSITTAGANGITGAAPVTMTRQVLGIQVASGSAQGQATNLLYLANTPQDFNGWASKVIGLLITGVAASLGAPLWFDALQKLINIRSAGLKPSEKESPGASGK